MQTSNGFPSNTFQITSTSGSYFVVPKNNCKTLFLGFGNGIGNEVKTLLFFTKTTSSSSSNGSRERKTRLRLTTPTTSIPASLLESPVLWAVRLCIFCALFKSGLAGSLSNPLLSDLDRNGGSGDGVEAESGDMGFSKWLNSIQAKSVKEAADRRKLVIKWHPTTKGNTQKELQGAI